MHNNNARLESILHQLKIPSTATPRLLNIGCGAFVESALLREFFPAWTMIGLDIIRLKKKSVWQVQADAVHLPFACTFGLILIRHPDVNKYPERWKAVLENLPHFLDGILLVTTYTFDELSFVRGCTHLPQTLISEQSLSAVPFAGEDKFFVAYARGS